MGIMHLSPSEFWKMTLPQLNSAMELHNEFQGGKGKTEPLTRNELEDLMTRYPD